MQNIDISIIEWLQKLSNGFFNLFFKVVTFFGDQIIFILVGVLIYWLYNKRAAFKLVFGYLIGGLLVGTLKVIVARPRPYTFSNIESISNETHGFSFPSGHSQASGSLFYGLKNIFRQRWLFYTLIAILILVPLSRMYLGQHFLTDVLVGSIIGILGAMLAFKVVDLMKEKEHIYSLYLVPIFLVALIVLLILEVNATNSVEFYDKFQDLFKMIGAFIAFSIGYAIEKVYVKHEVEASPKAKVLKVLVGLIPLALIYFGLSAIMPKTGIMTTLRYAIVVIWAILGAPFVFTKLIKNR